MNNEKYNQIIDAAYDNYSNKHSFNEKDCHVDREMNAPNVTYIPYNQEEFINKCKTDKDFSEKWGLKIEERELSDGERLWICSQRHHIRFGTNDGPTWYNPDNPGRDKLKWMTEDQRQLCDSKNIPTKLITITYNNETIEVYE